MAAMVLYLQGETPLALTRAEEAIRLARELDHPFSQAYALGCAAWLHSYRREAADLAASAQEAVDVSKAQAVGFWLLFGTIFGGQALVAAGQAGAGIAQIEAVLVPYRGFGSNCILPYFLVLLAEARAQVGEFDRALQDLEDARALIAQGEEAFAAAEVERMDAEVRLARAGGGLDAEERSVVERRYRDAHEIARRQGARLFALRAATGLACLLAGRGDLDAARRSLELAIAEMPGSCTSRELAEGRGVLATLGGATRARAALG
jgi:predicted ATPase